MKKRKWQQPQFQLHLLTKSHGRWDFGWPIIVCCTGHCSSNKIKKWCCIWCSDWLKLFLNSKFTERFLFTALWHILSCLMHLSGMFYSSALYIQDCLICNFSSSQFWAKFSGVHRSFTPEAPSNLEIIHTTWLSCVEKFAFWLVVFIKHSIYLTIKHQQLNETRS